MLTEGGEAAREAGYEAISLENCGGSILLTELIISPACFASQRLGCSRLLVDWFYAGNGFLN